MSDFLPLLSALSGWFHLSFEELPADLRERVESAFVIHWNRFTPEQRCQFAGRWDYEHDPATERERAAVAEQFDKMEAVEKTIEKWESIGTPTAHDLSIQEDRLQPLYKTRNELEAIKRQMRGDYLEQKASPQREPYDTNPINQAVISEEGKRNAGIQHAERNRLYVEVLNQARRLWENDDHRPHSTMAQYFKSQYPLLSVSTLRNKLADLARNMGRQDLINGLHKKG